MNVIRKPKICVIQHNVKLKTLDPELRELSGWFAANGLILILREDNTSSMFSSRYRTAQKAIGIEALRLLEKRWIIN